MSNIDTKCYIISDIQMSEGCCADESFQKEVKNGTRLSPVGARVVPRHFEYMWIFRDTR